MFEHGYLLGTVVTALGIYATLKFKEICNEEGEDNEL